MIICSINPWRVTFTQLWPVISILHERGPGHQLNGLDVRKISATSTVTPIIPPISYDTKFWIVRLLSHPRPSVPTWYFIFHRYRTPPRPLVLRNVNYTSLATHESMVFNNKTLRFSLVMVLKSTFNTDHPQNQKIKYYKGCIVWHLPRAYSLWSTGISDFVCQDEPICHTAWSSDNLDILVRC